MGDFSRYIPNTDADCRAMIEAIGVQKVEDLFEAIPKRHRMTKPLHLPEPLSEPDLLRSLQGLQSPAVPGAGWSHFLGAGAYHHFIPSVVPSLISRSEFYTAYMFYQPEIS